MMKLFILQILLQSILTIQTTDTEHMDNENGKLENNNVEIIIISYNKDANLQSNIKESLENILKHYHSVTNNQTLYVENHSKHIFDEELKTEEIINVNQNNVKMKTNKTGTNVDKYEVILENEKIEKNEQKYKANPQKGKKMTIMKHAPNLEKDEDGYKIEIISISSSNEESNNSEDNWELCGEVHTDNELTVIEEENSDTEVKNYSKKTNKNAIENTEKNKGIVIKTPINHNLTQQENMIYGTIESNYISCENTFELIAGVFPNSLKNINLYENKAMLYILLMDLDKQSMTISLDNNNKWTLNYEEPCKSYDVIFETSKEKQKESKIIEKQRYHRYDDKLEHKDNHIYYTRFTKVNNATLHPCAFDYVEISKLAFLAENVFYSDNYNMNVFKHFLQKIYRLENQPNQCYVALALSFIPTELTTWNECKEEYLKKTIYKSHINTKDARAYVMQFKNCKNIEICTLHLDFSIYQCSDNSKKIIYTTKLPLFKTYNDFIADVKVQKNKLCADNIKDCKYADSTMKYYNWGDCRVVSCFYRFYQARNIMSFYNSTYTYKNNFAINIFYQSNDYEITEFAYTITNNVDIYTNEEKQNMITNIYNHCILQLLLLDTMPISSLN